MNKEIERDTVKIPSVEANKGLHIEEPLIFEQGSTDRSGVDLPKISERPDQLGNLKRKNQIGLPGFYTLTLEHFQSQILIKDFQLIHV